MDGPGDYHTKWNKSDREIQISYDITYMWNLKKKSYTNELIYKTETIMDFWLPKGKDRGINWEFGIGTCNNQQGHTV